MVEKVPGCGISLARAFQKWVELTPDALAFKHNELALSYVEFNRFANRLAHALLRKGCTTGERIALVAREPFNLAIAQIAILKAGLVCVPMDPSFPANRLEHILRDCKSSLMLFDNETEINGSSSLRRCARVLNLNELPSTLPDHDPPNSATPETLAYLLYTSGSTGRPKGVMQNHRNMLHVSRLYRSDLCLRPHDRLTNPSSLAYTGSIWALLAVLTSGASFIVTEADSAHRFVEALAREGVTVAQAIVSLMRQIMLDLNEIPDLPLLRLIYTGGETLHTADVAMFTRIFPRRCKLMADLGSTEASIITHLLADEWFLNSRDKPSTVLLPCGRPVTGVNVILLDKQGNAVEEGEVGEIVIESTFLSPGYWNQPDLTANRFRSDPVNRKRRCFYTGDLGMWGEGKDLVHLGRIDDQVKVRGHRVHLSEVEAAIRETTGVKAAAVIASEDVHSTTRILAYVVLNVSNTTNTKEIRRRLSELLPTYMLPFNIVVLDSLPITDNGKLDRTALPRPEEAKMRNKNVSSFGVDSIIDALRMIWVQLLGTAPSSEDDNFLEMGGDSLQMMRLIGRIESLWGVHVSLKELFDHLTLFRMEQLIKGRIIHHEQILLERKNKRQWQIET